MSSCPQGSPRPEDKFLLLRLAGRERQAEQRPGTAAAFRAAVDHKCPLEPREGIVHADVLCRLTFL